MKDKIIKIGAEARLKVQGNRLLKERIRKGYRLSEIDLPLRKTRTTREANLMARARESGMHIPKIYKVDKEKMEIEMDLIDGELIDRVLDEKLAAKLGKEVAKMHNAEIIHGDLTTSNIIVKDNDLYFIDFGLGEVSNSVEKKGVDLKILAEAIRATHADEFESYFGIILKEYETNSNNPKEILGRFEKIMERGRYRKKKIT